MSCLKNIAVCFSLTTTVLMWLN